MATPCDIDNPSDASPDDAGRRVLLDRQIERLDALAEAGMDMVRALMAQADQTGPQVVEGDVALAYARVARAVRMAILLQTRLIEGPPQPRGSGSAKDDEDEYDGPLEVEWLTEPLEKDGPRRERVEAVESAERFDADPSHDSIFSRPFDQVIDDIRRDLGATATASEPAQTDSLHSPHAGQWSPGGTSGAFRRDTG